MVIKYKIRDSDWLTFPLIIVNFNHFFIQPAPDVNCFFISAIPSKYICLKRFAIVNFLSNEWEKYELFIEQDSELKCIAIHVSNQ